MVDGDVMIATNFHLVNAANRIKVSTPSGDVFLGKIVRLDEGRDLALIQIPTKTPQYFTLGDASSVDVGEGLCTRSSVRWFQRTDQNHHQCASSD